MNSPMQIPGMTKGWKIAEATLVFLDGLLRVDTPRYHARIFSPPGASWAVNSHGYGPTLAAAIQDAIDKSSARKRPTPDQIKQLAATLEQGEHDDT